MRKECGTFLAQEILKKDCPRKPTRKGHKTRTYNRLNASIKRAKSIESIDQLGRKT